MHKLVNGIQVPLTEKEIIDRQIEETKVLEDKARFGYKEQRRNEYPPIGEQLDMIYHDQINGTTVFLDTIQQIKNKYPKPE